MTLLDIQSDDITLTPAAAKAVSEIMEKRELTGYGLRVYIGGGGCSGYQYGMAFDDNIRESDQTFELHGVKLIVDEMSLGYLKGATIDYVDELMGSGFQIDNPNAVASCGCGQSFRTSDDQAQAGNGGGCY